MEDKALRERIYEKCMEKFDGETNTLWMHLEADGKLKTNGGWNKRIDAELGKGRKNAVVKGIGNIDAAIKKFEKTVNAPLHLFWAFPQNWDKKTAPIVAFMPFDKGDPEKRKTVPAFDSKGNMIELDNYDPTVAKQRPVIFVTFNERSGTDGKIKNGLMVVNTKTNRIEPFQAVNTQGKNPGAETHSEASNVRVDWITVSPLVGSEDEPWGQGQTEWIGTAENYDGNTRIWQPWVTMNLGAFQWQYYPAFTHSVFLPSGPVAMQIAFKYYEDDFNVGSYDIFDDWFGLHKFFASYDVAQLRLFWPAGPATKTEAETTAHYTFY